jgi:hypothetical protein
LAAISFNFPSRMNSALHGRATGGVHPSPSPAILIIRERGSLALDVALIDEASDPLAASSEELSAMPRAEPGKIENAVSKIGCETPVWRSLPLPER